MTICSVTNCKKHMEGGQWVCNRCEYVWDMSDNDPPVCITDREQLESVEKEAMYKMKGLLNGDG